MYTLIKRDGNLVSVRNDIKKCNIPIDTNNNDYQAFLAWDAIPANTPAEEDNPSV